MENKKITSNFIEKENSNYKWKDKVKLRELTEIPQENKVMAEDLNYLNKKPDIVKEQVSGEIKNVNDRVSNLVNNDFKKVLDELNETKKRVRDLTEKLNNLKPSEYAKDIMWHIDNNGKRISIRENDFQVSKKYNHLYFKIYQYNKEYSDKIFHLNLKQDNRYVHATNFYNIDAKELYETMLFYLNIKEDNDFYKIEIKFREYYKIEFENDNKNTIKREKLDFEEFTMKYIYI